MVIYGGPARRAASTGGRAGRR